MYSMHEDVTREKSPLGNKTHSESNQGVNVDDDVFHQDKQKGEMYCNTDDAKSNILYNVRVTGLCARLRVDTTGPYQKGPSGSGVCRFCLYEKANKGRPSDVVAQPVGCRA